VSRDADWSSKASGTAAAAKADESFQQSIGRFAPASSAANSSLITPASSSSQQQQQQRPLLLQGFVPAKSDQQRAANGSTISGSVEVDAPPLDVELAKKPPIDLFKSIFEVGALSLCDLLALALMLLC
jgi:hypothetical protein